MATNRNPITGDKIITKKKSKLFDENFDLIFRKTEPIKPNNDLSEVEEIIDLKWDK
jgi:hypothetical protein